MLIDPNYVTLGALAQIYHGASATLTLDSRAAVDHSAAIVARAAQRPEPVYGVNTGFGKLASVRISAAETRELQRNLVLSHCSGVGDPLPTAVVRLVMALKVIALGRGASGVRWKLIALLAAMLEHDLLPVIPHQGSVGASGDLVPLAHLAGAMIGEGQVDCRGERMPAYKALRQANLEPIRLHAKEGLALINGTQVSTALAVAGIFEAWTAVTTSITTGALSTDAAMGSTGPYHPDIHRLRGHKAQVEVAAALRELLANSPIRESHRAKDPRIQDPYCLRCQPQVLGAVLTTLWQAADTLRQEAGAVTDNPLVLPDGTIVSGGNFHGEPVGFAADMIAMAIAEAGAIAQRRIALLVDPALSFGLPPFLSPEAGLNSGMMAAEIISAALAAENKALTNPRVVDSTPTSANQEDHVAMSCHGAHRLLLMSRNLATLIGIEALCAAQGIELRAPLTTSPVLRQMMARIRQVSPPLAEDRPMSQELSAVGRLVQSGALLPPSGPELEAAPPVQPSRPRTL